MSNTGLGTKQLTVSIVDVNELLRAIGIRTGNGLATAMKSRVAASSEASPIAIDINGTRMRGFLDEVSYPGNTAACKLTAVDIDADDRVEYAVSVTLTSRGWEAAAIVIHVGIDD